MSHRKDRERFAALKRVNPDYKGFRGYLREAENRDRTPLEAMTCTVCGRKRNVPAGIALEQRDRFVCQSCQDADKE